MDGERRYSAFCGGDNCELWTRHDVSRRVHVFHSRVIVLVDHDETVLVTFAP